MLKKVNKRTAFSLVSVLVILLSLVTLHYRNKNPDVSGRDLTSVEQRSLIDAQRTALLSNEKPAGIFHALESRYDKLSPENKAIAVEIMYIAQQNATLYYNNMMYIMGGEVSINRPVDSMNALDAGKESAWVAGYIQDLKNNHLQALNLNEDMVLALPDFKYLEKYKDDATPSLRHLIEVGAQIQDLEPYTEDYFDVFSGNLAFELAMGRVAEIDKTNADEYQQHIKSLARLMHDSIFSFLQTNNISWNMDEDGDFTVSPAQIDGLEVLAHSEFYLKDKAQHYLNQIDNNKISASFISESSLSSVKEFGQSVYLSSAADIDNYYTIDEDGDIEPNKPARSGDVGDQEDEEKEEGKEEEDDDEKKKDEEEGD